MKDNKENFVTASINNVETAQAAELLKQAGDADPTKAAVAQRAIADEMTKHFNAKASDDTAQAVSEPIREGVLDGDIHSNIFLSEDFTNSRDMDIALDLLDPGSEKNHIAYGMPDHGYIPHRIVSGNYIRLNTYRLANAIDTYRKFFKNARFDVLRRMMEVLQAGFVKKKNDDAWQTLLVSGQARNVIAYDADAAAGQFTPKLVSIMRNVMRRNGGGNSTSLNSRRLTDLYMSPEAMEDMVSWGLDLIPDDLRSQIHRSENGGISNMFGVNFHTIDELGVGQEYQLFYTGTLSGSLAASDTELVVGLDLRNKSKAFIHPVSETLKVYEDNTRHRWGEISFYGEEESGWAVLDIRYLMLGSF